MSKQFFSLIHGEDIRLAPDSKVVPAKEFSKAMDANSVLNMIKEDAEKYRMEVATESEQVKEAAYRDGYEDGFKQWAEHVAALEDKIHQVQKEMEKMIVPFALNAAKKIVLREIELAPDVIVDIVTGSLKAVSQHKKIVIYVNKKDLQILEKNKKKLKDVFEHLESLSIRERDDVEEGGCVIETEGGIINAQISNKWQALEEAFKELIKEQQ